MIIVTGGAGFIGSMLVTELNKRGETNILIVDRLESDGKWKNLRGLSFVDYINADDFAEYMTNPDEDFWDTVETIYHMGACSSTTEKDMDFLWDNNVRYSQTLFLLAAQFDCNLVYASSAATYGDGENGYSDDHDLLKKLMPLNPYGYSKHYVDGWALKADVKPQKWYGVKFFNVFGPNEEHKGEMRSLVHKSHEQIFSQGHVNLFRSHKEGFKDGEQLRDFVYVKDVVRAMVELVESDASNGIYNMGTGQARSFYDLVAATFKALGKEPNIKFIDMPESIRSQYQYYTQANMDKFQQALPDFSFTSLEEAVDDYVNRHLQ